jgi:hypothetical protein
MSKPKYIRTAVILVQFAEDDPGALHSRVLCVNDREVFNALQNYTFLRQREFDAAVRAHLKKARKEGRRLSLDEQIPGLLPSASDTRKEDFE